MRKSIPPPTYLFRTVLARKQCLICAYFSPDSDETTFFLEKAILHIVNSTPEATI